MNWEAIGAISEGIGAAAVVITLVYLATQIRHGHIAQNAATAESVNQGFNAINGLISADPSLARIMLKANADLMSLDAVEQYRYWVTWQSYINQYSQMLSLYEAGALSKAVWETHLDALAGFAPQGRDKLNAPSELWAAVEAYGPPRRSAGFYHRAAPDALTSARSPETEPGW